MAQESVAYFASNFCHEFAHACKEDLWWSEWRNLFRIRSEEWCHQRVCVEVATEIKLGAVLPAIPDGAHGKDHLAHTCSRVAPLHRETLCDVWLNLATKAHHEATL